VMVPFSFSGKSWNDRAGISQLGIGMKLMGILMSYIFISKFMRENTLLNIVDGRDGCSSGCPLMDGGFTDNAPLTPVVAASARSAPRPPWMMSTGAAATMTTVKYLMGIGPLSLWTFGSINLCPFTYEAVCTFLSGLRQMVVRILPSQSRNAYEDIMSAYGIYRPEITLISPYCGDPLTYDLFESKCAAESVCDMWTTVIPSRLNGIVYTPDVYVLVFVMAYLQVSSVSARFVESFVPSSILEVEYYKDMRLWFPNFDAISPQKGGLAFTSTAGNLFMDYMTYLSTRLVGFLISTKKDAHRLSSGISPHCNFHLYQITKSQTVSREDPESALG